MSTAADTNGPTLEKIKKKLTSFPLSWLFFLVFFFFFKLPTSATSTPAKMTTVAQMFYLMFFEPQEQVGEKE